MNQHFIWDGNQHEYFALNTFWIQGINKKYHQKLNIFHKWQSYCCHIGRHDSELYCFSYKKLLVNGENYEEVRAQQDGATPHRGRNIVTYLYTVFIGCWMGWRVAFRCQARTPDLTPFEYFCGVFFNRIFLTKS